MYKAYPLSNHLKRLQRLVHLLIDVALQAPMLKLVGRVAAHHNQPDNWGIETETLTL